MKENNRHYKVWFDHEVNDFIAIESELITFSLLINLNKVNIPVKDVFANSRNEALSLAFPDLKKIEKPIRNINLFNKPNLVIID